MGRYEKVLKKVLKKSDKNFDFKAAGQLKNARHSWINDYVELKRGKNGVEKERQNLLKTLLTSVKRLFIMSLSVTGWTKKQSPNRLFGPLTESCNSTDVFPLK